MWYVCFGALGLQRLRTTEYAQIWGQAIVKTEELQYCSSQMPSVDCQSLPRLTWCPQHPLHFGVHTA